MNLHKTAMTSAYKSATTLDEMRKKIVNPTEASAGHYTHEHIDPTKLAAVLVEMEEKTKGKYMGNLYGADLILKTHDDETTKNAQRYLEGQYKQGYEAALRDVEEGIPSLVLSYREEFTRLQSLLSSLRDKQK